MLALAMAFVGETVPKEKTGSAMGLLGTMSAVGTALGPSLGGLLIAGFGWRAIFLVNVPLALVALALAVRHLPADRRGATREHARFDTLGTLLLASTLAAYALAVTAGHGRFGLVNAALLAAAAVGGIVFVLVETRTVSPLLQPAMFRDRTLSTSLTASALVATVMMTTFVVAPFYLARALGLSEAAVGLVMAVGPMIAIVSGIPSGRVVDRAGAATIVVLGLTLMAAGTAALAALPTTLGVAGYIAGIAILTPGYQLFQAANNTAVMAEVRADQRGVVSGLINLSRNLGLITGAAVMGAVFALASATSEVTTAPPAAIATGMRITFAVAAGLLVLALVIALAGRRRPAAR